MFGAEAGVQDSDELISVDSGNNFVLSDVPIALVGVRDLIVVVNDGIVMVCRKGGSQQVKDVVQRLKEDDRKDLL